MNSNAEDYCLQLGVKFTMEMQKFFSQNDNNVIDDLILVNFFYLKNHM